MCVIKIVPVGNSPAGNANGTRPMKYKVFNSDLSHSFGTYEAGAPVGALCNMLQDENYQAVLGKGLTNVLVAESEAAGEYVVESENGVQHTKIAKQDDIF